MSLDIRIDGLSADLMAGSTLEMSLVNPHFDYGKIVGATASLPAFPLSRRNQYIFGYYEQAQSGAILARRRLEQYYNGHLIREGQFLLTEAGPKGYAGQMVENLGEFFGDWQNRLLSELDLGILPLPSVVPMGGIFLDGQAGTPERAVVFPSIVNPDYYGTSGGSIGYSGRMNDYQAGGYTGNGPLVPMMMLSWLLKKIAMATTTTIDGALLSHVAYSQLLLYNTRALDGATSITLARHLPELTVAELLLELRKLLNLRFDFDLAARRLTIGFWDDALRKPAVIDWSDKAVGRPLKTPEPATRLQLGYELDSGDGLMKNKPVELSDYVSAGTATISALKSRFSTLLMDDATGTAKAAQPGITAQFGQLTSTFSPRLLFWNQMIGLPAASNALNGFSLYWNGAGGLYERSWQGLETMRQHQFYAKQGFLLTETDLARLNFGEKIHSNGVDYFVLSAEVSLPIRKPVECLLLAA